MSTRHTTHRSTRRCGGACPSCRAYATTCGHRRAPSCLRRNKHNNNKHNKHKHRSSSHWHHHRQAHCLPSHLSQRMSLHLIDPHPAPPTHAGAGTLLTTLTTYCDGGDLRALSVCLPLASRSAHTNHSDNYLLRGTVVRPTRMTSSRRVYDAIEARCMRSLLYRCRSARAAFRTTLRWDRARPLTSSTADVIRRTGWTTCTTACADASAARVGVAGSGTSTMMSYSRSSRSSSSGKKGTSCDAGLGTGGGARERSLQGSDATCTDRPSVATSSTSTAHQQQCHRWALLSTDATYARPRRRPSHDQWGLRLRHRLWWPGQGGPRMQQTT